MKIATFALVAVLSVFAGSIAQAKNIPLIRLTCETCSGVEIPLGLTVSDANPRIIQAVYYQDEAGKPFYFTSQVLKEMTLVYTYEGYKAAYIKLDSSPSAGTAKIHLDYMKNGLWKSYGSTSFNLKYNVNIGQYQVLNPDDQDRPVTTAFIIPNKWGKKMVGLKRVIFK